MATVPAASTQAVGDSPAEGSVLVAPPTKRLRIAPSRFSNDPQMFLPPKVSGSKGKGKARYCARALAAHMAGVDKNDVPLTYEQAMASEHSEFWEGAMLKEFNSHVENGTWKLVKRQPHMKVLPCKWVYKIKTDSEGKPILFKCRAVIGGHRQTYGVDFELTYAPVSRLTTMRDVMSVAAHHGWQVHQIDISTAFLHSEVDAEIYMEQPKGFEQGSNLVCVHTERNLWVETSP